jgi:NTP pyrophosphatase (non-canonical NTP hydrolase)
MPGPFWKTSEAGGGLLHPVEVLLQDLPRLEAGVLALEIGDDRGLVGVLGRTRILVEHAEQAGTEVLGELVEGCRDVRRFLGVELVVGVGLGGEADELGDLLFVLANLARKLDLDPEACIAQANRKFERRFGAIEAALAAQGRTPADATLAEMEEEWIQVKARGL